MRGQLGFPRKGGASGRGFKSFRKAPVMVASRQKLREVADQI